MKIKHILPLAALILFSRFALILPPPNPPNVFATFRFGTPVQPVLNYLSATPVTLADGGVARVFTDTFSSLGNAMVHNGLVVAYADTIRTLLLKIDTTESTKLWTGMTDLYGAEDSTIVYDSTGWLISKANFSMYYINGQVHARYRDREYFERTKLKNVIPSKIDSIP